MRYRFLRVAALWQALCLPVPLVGQENDIPNPATYSGQLKAEREESWLQEQLRRFTTFRHLDRAYQLTQAGRLAEAQAEFERYLAKDPADLEARANYLHLLYRLKDYGNLIKQADVLLSQKPTYVPAHMYKGFANQKLNRTADALEDFKRAAATPGAIPSDRNFALNTAAELAMQLGRYLDALDLLKQIPTESRDATIWFREAQAFEHSGNIEAAAESYRRSIKSSSDPKLTVTIHRVLADLAIKEEKWNEAEEELRSAAAILPADVKLAGAHQLARYEAASRRGDHVEALEAAEFLARQAGDPAGEMRVGMTLEKLGRTQEAAAAYARAEGLTSNPQQKLRAWRSAANAATKGRDWPTAELALKKASTLYPKDHAILHGLVDVCYQQKKFAEAADWMKKAIAVKPDLNDLEFLGNLYVAMGEYDEAARVFQRVLPGIRADQNRHRLYMALGYAYGAAGRTEAAAAAFAKAAAARTDPETLVSLVQSLETAGRLDQAAEYRRQLIEMQPSPENRYALGILYARLGRDEDALRQLEEALAGGLAGPKLLLALKQEAGLYQKQRRLTAARRALTEALALDPKNAAMLRTLAQIDVEAGDYESALRSITESLSLAETVQGLQFRAEVYQKLGDSARALSDYRRVASLLPEGHAESSSILVSLANLEFGARQYKSAALHYLEAFRLSSSGEPDPLVQAAESLALEGDWTKAVEINRRIIDLPKAAPAVKAGAYRRLGFAYARSKRPELAEESFRTAVAMGDTDSRTLEELGFLLFDSARFAEARDSFRASLGQQPSVQALLRLGRAHAAMGKPGVAIHDLQQALAKANSLSESDRDNIYRELGYLYAGDHEYDKASEAWRRSPAVAATPEITLRLARMQRLLQNYAEARRILDGMDGNALPKDLQGERLEELALSAYGQGNDEASVGYMELALAIADTPSRHYFLGLAYRRSNNVEKALLHLKQAAGREPQNDEYSIALGYTLRKSGRLRESIGVLEPVARRSPDYLNLTRDLGYFYMQVSDNDNASRYFRKAIDNGPLYSQRTEEEVLSVRRDLYRMRSEIRTINNRYDLAAYLAYRSNSGVGMSSVLGGGVLQSQGGLELGYQPPKAGFRAGRVFQVTGRLLWNTEPGSLRVDRDSWQAGLGVRYKPIPRQNLYISGERIFKIGDATTSGWLWRGMYSWARGRDLMPGGPVRNYTLFFGDGGYFTPNGGTTAFYSEIHQGAAFRLWSSALLKPHAVIDGRYQNRDVPRGSYVEAGGGLSLQLFFADTKYEVHRAGLEFLFQYKRAWLQPNPELQGDREFNGWTITSLILF